MNLGIIVLFNWLLDSLLGDCCGEVFAVFLGVFVNCVFSDETESSLRSDEVVNFYYVTCSAK